MSEQPVRAVAYALAGTAPGGLILVRRGDVISVLTVADLGEGVPIDDAFFAGRSPAAGLVEFSPTGLRSLAVLIDRVLRRAAATT